MFGSWICGGRKGKYSNGNLLIFSLLFSLTIPQVKDFREPISLYLNLNFCLVCIMKNKSFSQQGVWTHIRVLNKGPYMKRFGPPILSFTNDIGWYSAITSILLRFPIPQFKTRLTSFGSNIGPCWTNMMIWNKPTYFCVPLCQLLFWAKKLVLIIIFKSFILNSQFLNLWLCPWNGWRRLQLGDYCPPHYSASHHRLKPHQSFQCLQGFSCLIESQ